jgi:hypothetical protein
VNPDQKFWWNWWVGLGTAVGTVGAVVVALWQAFRRPKPRLKLRLLRGEGEKTYLNSGESARYYHLHVWNERRSCPADEVQVYVSRVEEPESNPKRPWEGNVPLRWRDQESVQPFPRIGSARDCDLCMIETRSGLHLMPLFLPNSLSAHHPGKCALVLFVQARSNQADSKVMRVEILWDGVWSDDDTEMLGHMRISCD